MVSTMPSEVSGLTKHDAPSAGVVPSGNGSTSLALMQRYCAYIAPPIIATVLPVSACAASDDPALITTPAPSLPTGMGSAGRADLARRHKGFRPNSASRKNGSSRADKTSSLDGDACRARGKARHQRMVLISDIEMRQDDRPRRQRHMVFEYDGCGEIDKHFIAQEA